MSFLQTSEFYLLSTAATLSGLGLTDGLITPPPFLPESVNQHEAAETRRRNKRKKIAHRASREVTHRDAQHTQVKI